MASVNQPQNASPRVDLGGAQPNPADILGGMPPLNPDEVVNFKAFMEDFLRSDEGKQMAGSLGVNGDEDVNKLVGEFESLMGNLGAPGGPGGPGGPAGPAAAVSPAASPSPAAPSAAPSAAAESKQPEDPLEAALKAIGQSNAGAPPPMMNDDIMKAFAGLAGDGAADGDQDELLKSLLGGLDPNAAPGGPGPAPGSSPAGGDANPTDIDAMMEMMMGSFLSKDVLYEPMKDLCGKYPPWLSKNEGSVPAADFTNYKKQHGVLVRLVKHLEGANPDSKTTTKLFTEVCILFYFIFSLPASFPHSSLMVVFKVFFFFFFFLTFFFLFFSFFFF